MNQREIKFRMYDAEFKQMILWDTLANREMYMVTWPNLMQFIGLKDKNDVEIYEGDILEELTNNETSKEIGVCRQVIGGWQIFNVKTDSICWGGRKQKIIGNIFETPDLIK